VSLRTFDRSFFFCPDDTVVAGDEISVTGKQAIAPIMEEVPCLEKKDAK
jgi:hypothetical protein